MADLFKKCREAGGYFGKYRVSGDHFFSQPVLGGKPGPRMTFQGREVIMWAINNYLGLAGREDVKKVAQATLDEYGTYSPMGSRLLTGNTDRHILLEEKLASFLCKSASVAFNYGYLGVLGTISAIVGNNDVIIIDKLSHASMIDAAILSSAGRRFRPFKHNDMDNLEFHLKAAAKEEKTGILVVTEGVFGMRGDLANLKDICMLKDRYGARLFVDDAHGFGVMGENGRGIGEHLGVQDAVDLYFGTFAKAFAAIGGVTAGDKDPVEYVRYNARTNVFAKSLPLIYVETILATLKIIESEPSVRQRMWEVAGKLQKGFCELGFDIGDTQSPVTPVYVPAGSQDTAEMMIAMLREDFGIFVSGVIYPVVPPGIVLFRMIPTAAHTDEDIEQTLSGFRNMRDRLHLDLSVKPSLKLK